MQDPSLPRSTLGSYASCRNISRWVGEGLLQVLLWLHPRPFEPSIKSHIWKILSTFGNTRLQNGFKNDTMAPRATLECHLWPSPRIYDVYLSRGYSK
jgi:hypothetical protein